VQGCNGASRRKRTGAGLVEREYQVFMIIIIYGVAL
jgi:hypothetical protein